MKVIIKYIKDVISAMKDAAKVTWVQEYYDGAIDYVSDTYVSPYKPKHPQEVPPEDDSLGTENGGKASLEMDPFAGYSFSREIIDKSGDNRIRYSVEDDEYDLEAVDDAMSGEITARSITDLDAVLDRAVKQSFVDRVIDIIRQKGIRDSAVYKAAQIDRRLFSKMMSDKNYKPAKDTAIAIALALELPLAEANDLLARAGYMLSHSNKRDIVIEYFFRERMYNLHKINTVLDLLHQKLVGR